MVLHLLQWAVLLAALSPFAYYALAAYCGWEYFRKLRRLLPLDRSFTPPASILKPVRGLDREGYENFASFCRLDYPEYEVVFAVVEPDDPVIPIIQKLQREFPKCAIHLVAGIERAGTSPKMSNLCRLVKEAKYDLLVISDSDVRVETDYLLDVAAPFADPKVGVVTAFFCGLTEGGFAADVDAVGVPTDASASTLVARKLGGIDFALGWTMATTKARLAEIGGFESMVDHHSDDFVLGNEIAKRGYGVELTRKPVWMVFPNEKLSHVFKHELRWSIMLRGIRPAGYLGMAMTFGLPWSLLAAAVAPSTTIAAVYLLAYLVLRLTVAWVIGAWGLGDPVVRKRIWLVPVRDALNFAVYVASYFSDTVRWRGLAYRVRGGSLVPLNEAARK